MKKTYTTPGAITNGGVVQETKDQSGGISEAVNKLPEAGSVGFHL